MARARSQELVGAGVVVVALGSVCALGSVFFVVAPGSVALGWGLVLTSLGWALGVGLVLLAALSALARAAVARERAELSHDTAAGETHSVRALPKGDGSLWAAGLGVALLIAGMAWLPIHAVCAVLNARHLGPAEAVTCTVTVRGTKTSWLTCQTTWSGELEDRQSTMAWVPARGSQFTGLARPGALGVWMLDTQSIQVTSP
jgi:hypothetical protein